MNNQDYVAGLYFDLMSNQVVLIRKTKPEWQRGRLNAIGGKIEAGETPMQAMLREFKEETGVYGNEWREWREFCQLKFRGGIVYFFETGGNTEELKTMEEEEVFIVGFEDLENELILENLKWLIPLALDKDQVTAIVEDKS